MSAYVVEKEHVIYLVKACLNWVHVEALRVWVSSLDEDLVGLPSPNTERLDAAIAQALWDVNIEAVRDRYPEGPLPGPAEIAPIIPDDFDSMVWPIFDALQVAESVLCYEYQCDEWPLWGKTFAKLFCDNLSRMAVRRLTDQQGLVWGCPEPVRVKTLGKEGA